MIIESLGRIGEHFPKNLPVFGSVLQNVAEVTDAQKAAGALAIILVLAGCVALGAFTKMDNQNNPKRSRKPKM